jgi:uncharacterized protein (DUF934 family)
MALLRDGRLTEDPYLRVPEGAPLPPGPALIDLARVLAGEVAGGRTAPLGVLLPPDAAVDVLAPWLPDLALIVLRLPGSRDGRAFTQARALREHHHFRGELRATGHVLPDHLTMLRRVGVDSIELPATADPVAFLAAARRIDIAYQPSLDGGLPLGLRRLRLETA